MEHLLSYFSLFEKIILIIAFFAFVAQLYYYLAVFGRVAFFRRVTPAPPCNGEHEGEIQTPPVSVIICARNEEVALEQNLHHVLEQAYPEFEVIVVNDCSEDDSEILLASMQEKYPNLIFRTLVKDEVFKHNKKMALGVGIKAARYDLLLFLDADCYPPGPHWLSSMASRFTPKTDVVLGYTRLKNNRRWVRADRLMRALHYLGKALKRKPYMGVGSNLAYRKQLFFEHKGFDIRITGNLREDCVFINKVATRDNTAAAVAPEAVNVSALRIAGERWRRERREEIRSFALCEKGSRYPELAEILYRLVFFATMTAMMIHFREHPVMLPLLSGVVLLRLLLQFLIFFRTQRHLGEKGLSFMLLLWDLVFPLFYLWLLSTSKSYRKQSVNYR
ncbi:MAG: glycosyltransferase [Prevotellaceae bacterium]|jgi:glycosyltransferase involved in cell wall biosynthesis|nr:glycosyltransferase [Prevotellaceae bacterium]